MPDDSIRQKYEEFGSAAYYRESGADYRNPHEKIIRKLVSKLLENKQLDCLTLCDSSLDATEHKADFKANFKANVLDLACGSGEITLALRELGIGSIEGIDPYTFEAYQQRTGQSAEKLFFEEIAAGKLTGRNYRCVICSFALHLIDISRLPSVLTQLALISPQLVIITPHKRPIIASDWGWTLDSETIVERVRGRVYHSTLFRLASE